VRRGGGYGPRLFAFWYDGAMPQLDEIYSRQHDAEHYSRFLQEGYAPLGWSGDPDLILAFNNGPAQRWEVLRHEPLRNLPNRHVIVCAGPAGQGLNDSAIFTLIQHLVAHDTHRAGNSHIEQVERMMKANEKREADRTAAAADATAESLSRFYHEAGKALGVTETTFAI